MTDTNSLGHPAPWGYECPGWPYCHQPAQQLRMAIAEYEAHSAEDPIVADLLADSLHRMRTELNGRVTTRHNQLADALRTGDDTDGQ